MSSNNMQEEQFFTKPSNNMNIKSTTASSSSSTPSTPRSSEAPTQQAIEVEIKMNTESATPPPSSSMEFTSSSSCITSQSEPAAHQAAEAESNANLGSAISSSSTFAHSESSPHEASQTQDDSSMKPTTSSSSTAPGSDSPTHKAAEATSTSTSTSSMTDQQPEVEFKCFQKFPKELRDMIWKFAGNIPRHVTVEPILGEHLVLKVPHVSTPDSMVHFVNITRNLLKNVSSTPPPSILSVNKESREVGLTLYEKTFGTEECIRGIEDLVDASQYSNKIYFNHNVDTLFLKLTHLGTSQNEKLYGNYGDRKPIYAGELCFGNLTHGIRDRLRSIAFEVPQKPGSRETSLYIRAQQKSIIKSASALEVVVFYQESACHGYTIILSESLEQPIEYPIKQVPTLVRGYPSGYPIVEDVDEEEEETDEEEVDEETDEDEMTEGGEVEEETDEEETDEEETDEEETDEEEMDEETDEDEMSEGGEVEEEEGVTDEDQI